MFFSFRYSVVFMKDKKIVWDWLPPFDLLLQDKDFQAGAKKSPDKSGLKKREEKKELLDWRRERDSNPRRFDPQQFSRLPQSTTLPTLRAQKYKTGA